MGYRQKLGTPPITSFSDNFTRPDKDTLGPTWVQMSCSNPGANGSNGFASIQTNKGRFAGSGAINPPGHIVPAWVPRDIIPTLYGENGTFVECVFDSNNGASWGLCAKLNRDQNLPVAGVGAECYILVNNGRLDKLDDAGGQTTIGASTWVLAAGDTIRMETVFNPSAGTVTVKAIRNGVTLQTVVDGPGSNEQPFGWPGIILYAMSGTPINNFFKLRSFNCGKL